jgi:hypothetical protein
MLILLLALIALNAAMVLSLRSFPSHDGPMHVYLAMVAGHLLSGGKDYGQYFALKSLVTPYAFNTYALIAFHRLFDPLLSERLYVCLCVALLLGGFLALARSVSPAWGAAGLLAVPLALHKSVFLGFQNFCAAIGMTSVLCAFWMTHFGSWRWWKTAAFVAMLALLSVTHPVGVLVTGLSLVVHMSVLAAPDLAKSSGPWPVRLSGFVRRFRLQLVHLALCLFPLVFISRFTLLAAPGSLVFSIPYAAK